MGDRRLKPGDEVITVAAGFPTTVNPILQNNLVPVFIDVSLPTFEVDVTQLDAALSDKNARGDDCAHSGQSLRSGRGHRLSPRSTISGSWKIAATRWAQLTTARRSELSAIWRPSVFIRRTTSPWAKAAACSTDKPLLKTLVESFRDWGRDCWCEPGKDNTCGKRFDWQLGDLPCGYDHKYTYSHIGYNLKLTDMQAAVGVSQLKKLPGFIAARRRNFEILYEGLKPFEDVLMLPAATPEQ